MMDDISDGYSFIYLETSDKLIYNIQKYEDKREEKLRTDARSAMQPPKSKA